MPEAIASGADTSNEARLTRIQALVVEILNELLRAPIDETDQQIHTALARLGGFCGSDRAYVFTVRGGDLIDNSHEWCSEGIDPAIDELQGMPIEAADAWMPYFDDDLPVHIPDVLALPEDSVVREVLEPQGILSLVVVPMRHDGKFFGFVGFDSVRSYREFLPGELYLLKSVADVITSVLLRRISDRAVKKAQRELSDERAFLKSILDTSVSGIMVFDANARVIFTNEAVEHALGVPREKLMGQDFSSGWEFRALDETLISMRDMPFHLVRRSGKPVGDLRMAMSFEGGPRRYIAVNAAPISSEGDDLRVVLAITDVSAQTMAEIERGAALDEARRATLAKSRFLAKMSHEMRTPLNGVLGIAELLESMLDGEEQKRLLTLLRDSGGLLMNIINDLLDMSKIEADQLEVEQVPFCPAELARQIEAVHTLKAADKGLSFSLRVGTGAEYKRLGDPHRLSQILHNVVSNALKFTETGEVTVRLDCEQGKPVKIEIADTGIGMNPEQVARVFDEFGQADSSISRRFGGTGLGMSITQRLVALMGGEIEVDSEVGKGTVVRIILPLPMAEDMGQSDAPESPVAAETGSASGLEGVRVIAADDNRTNRLILEAMLRHLGVEATLCPDGPELLEKYAKERFDVVILDISMPGMDGIEVLRELRELQAEPGADRVPVLAYTANAMSHQVASYLAAGFEGCLTKPLRRERLHQALLEQTRRLARV